MTTEVDEALIMKLKEGSEQAFNEVYSAYHVQVLNFCIKLMPTASEASEIHQRVFVALWEQRNQIDSSKPLGGYIFSIAKYMVYSDFKQRVYRKAALENIAGSSSVFSETTKDEVLYNELVQILNNIIEKLPEQRRLIFTLSRFECLTYKEIAIRLGISENTVDTQIRRALGYIRKEYNTYFL